MKQIVIGFLGSNLDRGKGQKRWNKWRPTVSICMQEDMLISTFYLLYFRRDTRLLERTIEDINSISPETKVVPVLVHMPDPWNFETVYAELYDFSRSIDYDLDNQEYFVHITTGTHVGQICMYLLTESRNFPGKLLQTGRNADNAPEGECVVIDLDLSKYDQLAMRFQKEQDDDISFLKSGIETRNDAFNKLIERIEKVAGKSIDPMLLTGPTGAGKSQLARKIYDLKRLRKQVKGEFVELNCATLRGDAAMSTLFGHKKGAFTGAVSDRAGVLKAANNGIVFLDEIGELGLDEQAMLLHAIEEKRFMPVGSDSEVSTDFQLICGTNRDLRKDVTAGKFREDLLARINMWSFKLPGLVDRPEDIEPNLTYELERFSERTGLIVSFNKEAHQKFLAYATSAEAVWSANFRDLNAAVTRMSTLCDSGRIRTDIVEEEIQRLKTDWSYCDENGDNQLLIDVLGEDAVGELDLFDKPQLAEVIKVSRESKTLSAASRKLFAVSRKKKKSSNDSDRLKKYLAKFNLTWDDISL